MANPQKENGYTPIANEIFDALARTNLQSSERRVLDTVLRKTYGYNKKEDAISLSQLMEVTNLGKRTIIYAIQNLEAKNMIEVRKKDYDSNIYKFNKDYDTWVVQRNSEQYENMLIQKRNKYQKVGSAEKSIVVQRNDESGAEKDTLVVQRKAKKVRISAHTKDKRNKIQQKTGEEVPDKPVQIDGKQIEEARNIRDIIEAFTFLNPACKKLYGNITQREACEDLIREYGFERVMFITTQTLPKTNMHAYFPTILTPHQLFQDWKRLEAAVMKSKSKVDIKNQEKTRGLA